MSLIGIGGGSISALEYRLALLMGSRWASSEDRGRAADVLLDDDRWEPTRGWPCSNQMHVRSALPLSEKGQP